MRHAVVLALGLSLIPGLALSQDNTANTTLAGPPSGIMINTSISLNLPLTGADRDSKQAEEDAQRRGLYARSVKECALLLDSVAKSCVITSISISTQINSNPGQPDYLYVSSNIGMQVELK
jgi:hypothetical protein